MLAKLDTQNLPGENQRFISLSNWYYAATQKNSAQCHRTLIHPFSNCDFARQSVRNTLRADPSTPENGTTDEGGEKMEKNQKIVGAVAFTSVVSRPSSRKKK